jgi:hypothetical protein
LIEKLRKSSFGAAGRDRFSSAKKASVPPPIGTSSPRVRRSRGTTVAGKPGGVALWSRCSTISAARGNGLLPARPGKGIGFGRRVRAEKQGGFQG